MAAIDVPHFCAEAGHRLKATEDRADHTRFTVRKA
ncbi:sulfurtransferase TusA family protein [Rhodosalinus sp.]